MKRSMFSKERADKLPNPPSLIGRLASEKENHSRHVKQLSTHNNNLQNSNEQQQTQTDELTKQLCALRNQTETQARQLLTMKKMLGFIADEKKFEQAKVEAAKSKISKLESKLGLSIGNTGLGKKNAELRSHIKDLSNNFKSLKEKSTVQGDELVKAASEINVLTNALELKQSAIEEYSNGRKVTVRESCLYQLSLRKSECHNLALELAERSKRAKATDAEIGQLLNDRTVKDKELEVSEAHISHLTEQLVQYDKSSTLLKAELESKRIDISELLGYVEKLSADNSNCLRKMEGFQAENEQMKVKIEAFEEEKRNSRLDQQQRVVGLEEEVGKKIKLHKATEERLMVSINFGRAQEEKVKAMLAEREKYDTLEDDLGAIRKGLRAENEMRVEGELEIVELKELVANLNRTSQSISNDVSRKDDELARVKKERDCALQQVVDMGLSVQNSGVQNETTGRMILQHSLLEQLSHERTLRKSAEENSLRLLTKFKSDSDGDESYDH